jgi:periplasmic protein TonB
MEAMINNLDDLIFRDRNQNYGAYANRKNYSRYLLWALMGGTALFLTGTSVPLIANYVKGDTEKDVYRIVVTDTLTKIDLDKEKLTAPPDQKAKKPEYNYSRIVPTPDTTQDFGDLADLQDKGNNNLPDVPVDTGGTDAKPPDIIDKEDPIETVRFADKMPEFPGGEEGRLIYLAKNTVYPDAEKRAGIEGTVYITFVVDENGDVTEVNILRGVSPGIDMEAIKVVQNMPRWSPGLQQGRMVRVAFNMQIIFRPLPFLSGLFFCLLSAAGRFLQHELLTRDQGIVRL